MVKSKKHNDLISIQNKEASELNVAQLPSSENELGSFPARLQQVIGSRSVRSFAGDCGMSDTVVRQYLSGKSEPTRPAIIAIARISGCSIDWLMTGEGEMKRGAATAEPVAAAKAAVADPGEPFAQDAESEELCRLLKRYGNRALVEDVKARLLKIKAVVEG